MRNISRALLDGGAIESPLHCSIIGTTAALIAGGLSAAGALGGAAMGASAAGNAADAQANAAEYAANLQNNQAQEALDFQKYIYGNALKTTAPWLTTGTSSIANLASLLGVLPSDSTTAQTTRSLQPPAQNATPRFGGNVYTDSHGTWQYAGSDGQNDVYTRTNGGQAWLTLGPGGRQSAAGAYPNMGSLVAPGQPMPGQGGTAGQPGSGATPGQPPLSSYINPDLGAPGSLLKPFQTPFVAPTDVTEQNDPGYQFRLAQGDKLLENSAAARGGLLSGGTAKALEQYGQDYASSEYGKVYDRAMQQYQLNQNNALQQFNLLGALSGTGQVAAGGLNAVGENAANTASNTLLTSGAQIGSDIQNAAAARASGYAGGANALSGGLGSLTSMASLLALLKGLPNNSNSQGAQDYNLIKSMGGLQYI